MARTEDLNERFLEFDDKATPVNILKWGKQFLNNTEIEDSAVSAEVLLAHLLSNSRSEILINTTTILEINQIEQYKKLLIRRSNREPLQYISGITEFYNITVKCDKRALIPRPETEVLCDTVIQKLGSENNVRILDIGTGSGNIALTLWKNIKSSKVIGIDISNEALNLARENAEFNKADDRIEFISGDINDDNFINSLGQFNCIVSNPPYVSDNEKEILQPEVIEHEPHAALFSPGDSLWFYKRIIEISKTLLTVDGIMAFETGYDQAKEVKKLMASNFIDIRIIKDLAGIDRVVIAKGI